jgi:DNA-binding transcriptional ArsR family regulator
MAKKMKSAPKTVGADPADFKTAAQMIRLVSEPMRIMIVDMLESGERPLDEIVAELGEGSRDSIGHHLTLMRVSNLVESRRMNENNQGRRVAYKLTDRGLQVAGIVRAFLQ